MHSLDSKTPALIRPGYAIEYDFVQPTELDCRRSKRIAFKGCFSLVKSTGHRGTKRQQPRVIAGINARTRRRAGKTPSCSDVRRRYIGVLVDDSSHARMPRAVSHVHVESRASLAASNRQCRSSTDAAWTSVGLVDDEHWEQFEAQRRARYEKNATALEETSVVSAAGQRMLASQLLRQPEVKLGDLIATKQGRALDVDAESPEHDLASWRRQSSTPAIWSKRCLVQREPGATTVVEFRRMFPFAACRALSGSRAAPVADPATKHLARRRASQE